MMLIQHHVRLKSPLIHKILFLSALDPIILRVRAVGLFLTTLFFMLYFFILFLLERTMSLISKRHSIESIAYIEVNTYVVSWLLLILFASYWLNKVVLAVIFWSIVFIIMLFILGVYTLIYVFFARKQIEREQEEQRRRTVQERYRADENSAQVASVDEESKQSSNENSSSSDESNIINKLIQSMKKTFSLRSNRNRDTQQ